MEGYVPVHVAPELDSSLVLIGEPPVMRALVAGRASDLVKLYSTPLMVRHAVSGSVPDTLAFVVTAGDVRVPADLRNDVRVLDVEPRSIMLRFVRIWPAQGKAKAEVQRSTSAAMP
jgi:hypothetical protein